MAETQQTTATEQSGRRKTIIGRVVSTSMNKTIVVEVKRTRAHSFYRRVISHTNKFYAHDEQNTARVGDFVKLEETRPMSKLKRWRLKEVIRRAKLVGTEAVTPSQAGVA